MTQRLPVQHQQQQQQQQPRLQPQNADDNVEPMELDIGETDDQNELPVFDEVQLDLESYISPYHGLNRIYRLEFIADHCKSLRVEALKMALDYIQETSTNVRDYVRLFKKLEETKRQSVPSSSFHRDLKPDTAWIDVKTKQAALKQEKLESELKNFRANYIKENLRRAQDDLGEHYMECGDLESAFNAFSRSRDYVTTPKNQINQCLNVIRVSILLKRWSSVSNHVLRAESNITADSQIPPNLPTKLQCAAGLYELNLRRYKEAARHLLSTNFDHFEHAESNLLAPVNIVVYGSLCALATYNRQELANQLVNSASFRQFSELDTQLRDAVANFYVSKYAPCLALLQDIKKNLQLDLYLAPHVENLYRLIRNRALVQYFEPYSSACLRKMATSFSADTIDELEKEIINLICDGHIKARIDSHQKILYASNVDSRSQIFERAIEVGKLWQRQAQALISRTAILNAGIKVSKRISETI